MDQHPLYVGVAGWSIARTQSALFAAGISHLARYATRFNAVEINSSFYRPHQPATYARWATTTPSSFRFAVKMPRTITHQRRLQDCAAPLGQFFDQIEALGDRLGPVLVQLPPQLSYDAVIADTFWHAVRDRFQGELVCEPRHPGWFTPDADLLLQRWHVARVAADPAPVPHADEPGGWSGLRYMRLHGSPRRYYDSYDDATLAALAGSLVLMARQAPVWCIFDNTAAGAATLNAFRLLEYLHGGDAAQ